MGWYCPRCGHEADAGGTCPRDGEPLAQVASHDLLGHRLGEYTVLASLGGGSFGRVYRAVHARSGMLVAIKLLHEPIHGEERQRVLTEARAAAMIRHPNVVQVYDLALAGDRRPYIVMQLLDGSSLASVLHRPLPVAFALSLAADILAALGAAHALGIVHRDLKPENVFVAGGRAILVDFGLAKLIADPRAPNLTITGEAIGTPHYMAPEQVRGAAADGRADLYAAGCVVFEMLAGRPPFEGGTFQLFDAHLNASPPALAALRPDAPAHVDAAITRALAKDPAARFPDAAAMQRALAGHAPRRRRWPLALAGATSAAALATVAAIAAAGGESRAADDDRVAPRRVEVPPRDPGEPEDPAIEATLRAIADTFERGDYTRPVIVRLRCALEDGRAAGGPHTPPTVRAYFRRAIRMIDEQVAIDVAADCATPAAPTPAARVAIPPPLAGEPPLGADLEQDLVELQQQLERGLIGRATALVTVCEIYRLRHDRRAYPATLRAFHRRFEQLLRGYHPDLDARECPDAP